MSQSPRNGTECNTGVFYVDHNHPFGAACASNNPRMIANAALKIWEGKGVSPVLKYKDDLNAFRYPSAKGPFVNGNFHYDYDHAEILRRIKHLGIP